MTKKQGSLSKDLEDYFKTKYSSPYNFALLSGFKTASLAYMLRNDSFKIDKLEELGDYDEKVIDITITYLINKKKEETLRFKKDGFHQENLKLKQKVNELQEKLIILSEKLISLQSKMAED